MNSTDTGKRAEQLVANELKRQGYEIVTMNWKRPDCEIDIIARDRPRMFSRTKPRVIFTEVKYRSGASSGSGLEHIDQRKIDQISFAAERWCLDNDYDGAIELLAAEVNSAGEIKIVVIEQ